jgi:hypothetical protein
VDGAAGVGSRARRATTEGRRQRRDAARRAACGVQTTGNGELYLRRSKDRESIKTENRMQRRGPELRKAVVNRRRWQRVPSLLEHTLKPALDGLEGSADCAENDERSKASRKEIIAEGGCGRRCRRVKSGSCALV